MEYLSFDISNPCIWRLCIHSITIIIRMCCKHLIPCSIGPGSHFVNILNMYWQASFIFSARKMIQPIITKRNVMVICPISLKDGRILFSATVSLYFLFFFISNNGRNNRAWNVPQQIKVQLAPCQSPLTKKIIMVFRKDFHLLQRLPPNGIYM